MIESLFGVEERDKEAEEMLFEMSTDDFIENEIEEQISESLFSSNKTNHVEFYLEKYKYLCKEVYVDDDDTLAQLEENKENFLQNIVSKISETFEFEIDENEVTNKVAKTLYNFFIVNYADNLKDFFLNFLNKNKKSIIADLKAMKVKTRDVSTIASKVKYYNANDAIIINNINTILLKIIPNYDIGNEFIDYIINYDDSRINNKMRKYLDEAIITFEDTYNAFLTPFVEKHDGYSSIISDIVIELNEQAKTNKIDIFAE